MEDDRPSAILSQSLFDLPHDLSPLLGIGLAGLLVDQFVDFCIAIAGVVTLRPAGIVLVEHLVGIIEPRFSNGETQSIILAHNRRIALGSVDRVKRSFDK